MLLCCITPPPHKIKNYKGKRKKELFHELKIIHAHADLKQGNEVQHVL